MSVRSYTKIWLHLIWGTHDNIKYLTDSNLRKEISRYFHEYSTEKNIFMRVNYVNNDHVHALIDLPTNKTIEEVLQLLKGSSSNWINKKVNFKFAWKKGYGAFSVSDSNVDRVVKYISNQEEHHRVKNFAAEYEEFAKKHSFVFHNEECN